MIQLELETTLGKVLIEENGYLGAILIAYISSGNISDNTSISPTIDSIVAGTMVSFLVWTAVVIFVFSTKSALSATLYVMSSCIVIIGIISYIYRAI
jgi:hypothetical protein